MTNDVILKFLKNENYDRLIKEIEDALQFDSYNPVYYYYRWLAKNKGYLNADFDNLIDKEDLVKALDLDLMDVVDREYDFFKILPKDVRILFAYANYMDEEKVNKYISSSAIKDSKFFYDRKEVKPLYDYAMDLRIESQMKLTGKVVLSFIENRSYTTDEELKCKAMLEEIVKHFEDRLFITITNTPSRWAKTEELSTPIEEVKVDEVVVTPNVEEVKVENPKEETFSSLYVENPKEKVVLEPKAEIKEESFEAPSYEATNSDYYYNTDYNYKKPEEEKKVSYSNYDNNPSPANGKIHFGVLFPFIFVGAWIAIVIFIINSNKAGNGTPAIVFLVIYSVLGLVSLFLVSKRIKKGFAALYLVVELGLLVTAITISVVNQGSPASNNGNNGGGGYSAFPIQEPSSMPNITCSTSASRYYPGGNTNEFKLSFYLDPVYEGAYISQIKGTFTIVDSNNNTKVFNMYLSAAATTTITVRNFYALYVQSSEFKLTSVWYSDYSVKDNLNITGDITIDYGR